MASTIKYVNDIKEEKSWYIPEAEGIRGLAVLIVLVAHSLVMFLPSTRTYLVGSGKIGVWLFFVLSAFLLTNNFIRTGLNKKTLIKYIFGRFTRIIPMFLIASLFYFIVGYFDFNTLIGVITFNKGYGHLWTIPVEFKFYFTLPVVIILFQKLHKRFGLSSVLFCTFFFILTARYFFPPYIMQENSIHTRWYISSFFVGVFVSYLVQFRRLQPRRLGVQVFLCIVGVFMVIPAVSTILFGNVFFPNLSTSYLSLSIFWGLFIYLSVSDVGFFSKITTSRIMRSIGNHSFSTYLFHWFILTEMAKKFPNSFLMMITAIIISLLLGAAIYFLIERNIENARHFFQNRIASTSS